MRSLTRAAVAAPILAVMAVAALPAAAQTAPGAGLRTLTWPGKPAQRPALSATAAVAPSIAPPPIQGAVPTAAPSPAMRAPSRYSPTPAPVQRPNGLTPASAFYAPPVAPAPVASAPVAYAAAAPVAPPPVMAPSAASPPTPAPVATPTAADPNAPRRDAPIFRMGGAAQPQPAPQPQPPGMAAPQPAPDPQGARYYSVHRAAGRAPDATPIPAPVFLDAMPVDLAEPPGPPEQVRRNGLNPIVADVSDLP